MKPIPTIPKIGNYIFNPKRGGISVPPPVNLTPPEILTDYSDVGNISVYIDSTATWQNANSVVNKWYINNVLYASETGSTLLPIPPLTTNDEVFLRQTATNTGGSTSIDSNIEIIDLRAIQGLATWVDSKFLDTIFEEEGVVVTDGATVSEWRDKVGAYHWYQDNTLGNRPRYYDSFNGPHVEFSGFSSNVYMDGPIPLNLSNVDYTLMVVSMSRNTDPDIDRSPYWNGNRSTDIGEGFYINSDLNRVAKEGSGTVTASQDASSALTVWIMQYIAADTRMFFYQNGVLAGNAMSTQSDAAAYAYLGQSGMDDFFQGPIYSNAAWIGVSLDQINITNIAEFMLTRHASDPI